MSSQNHPANYSNPLPPPPPDWQPLPPRRRSGRAGKALAALIIILLLLWLLFYTPLGNNLMSGLTGNSYARSSTFTLTREITIDTTRAITYMCDIPIPGTLSSTTGYAQLVSGLAISPPDSQVQKYGGYWMEWTGTATGQVSMSITCTAEVHTIVWDIDSEISGTMSELDDAVPQDLAGRQTGDEWELEDEYGTPTGEFTIWPSHPTISQLADSLTSEDVSVYENVKLVYDYMRANYEYQTISGSGVKACLQTLADKSGDCDDQSILLISLLRSIGIPSWLAFGTLYDGVRAEWGPHAWAEVYIPLKSGGGETVVIDVVNDEFLVRNCNRLEEWKSDGIGEHLSDYYHLLSYNYTSMPHQPAPIVSISDDYSGHYQASKERVYAIILDMTDINAPISEAGRNGILLRKLPAPKGTGVNV